jgi:hypothetical protein
MARKTIRAKTREQDNTSLPHPGLEDARCEHHRGCQENSSSEMQVVYLKNKTLFDDLSRRTSVDLYLRVTENEDGQLLRA